MFPYLVIVVVSLYFNDRSIVIYIEFVSHIQYFFSLGILLLVFYIQLWCVILFLFNEKCSFIHIIAYRVFEVVISQAHISIPYFSSISYFIWHKKCRKIYILLTNHSFYAYYLNGTTNAFECERYK